MKIFNRKTAAIFSALVMGAMAMMWPGQAMRAQTAPAQGGGKSYDIDVPGTKEWVDTNIDVRGGAELRFTATGSITYPADTLYKGKSHTSGTFGPDGLPRGWADLYTSTR